MGRFRKWSGRRTEGYGVFALQSQADFASEIAEKGCDRAGKSLWYKYLSQYPIRFQRQKQSEDSLRTFTAQRLNWRLNWTAASIFRTKERHMMKAEQPVLKNMESPSSVFPTPKLIDILNPCVK